LTERQIRDKVVKAQTLKGRQSDWLDKDRELWSKLDIEPVDATLDSVYDYLDGKTDLDLDDLDEETLASVVPSLGLKDVYMTPNQKRRTAPMSPKQKQLSSPNRVRIRDLVTELEGKSSLLREAEAAIERQALVIKRISDNFEELTERYKTEQRFRVEAEQHGRLMEEQLDRLQMLLAEQQQLRDALQGELRAAQTRTQLVTQDEGAQRSLQIFEDLRAQQVQAQEEIVRLKQAYARVTSEKMQEKSFREVSQRQISELVAEIEELKAKLQLRVTSPYAQSAARPTYNETVGPNDSYFSPIAGSQQGTKSMGFTIPPAAEVHRSRSIIQKNEAAFTNSSSLNLHSKFNPGPMGRGNSESDSSTQNKSDDSLYNDYDSPLELTAELEELLNRTGKK
jgi:predicted  nucleic acid-binding Zn-ribbon protein